MGCAMKHYLQSFLLLALMLCTATMALLIKPTQRLADSKPQVSLERMIPTSFGDWSEIAGASQQIVNPQELKILNALYSQTLSRTFVNSNGYRIMLSVAYGGDQSRDLGVHRPEVCYAAQGFQLSNQHKTNLQLGNVEVPAMRMQTRLESRFEPVTYWIRIGDKVVRGNLELGFARLSYGVKGQIADGLLVRLSSIDADAPRAFKMQDTFARDLSLAVRQADLPTLLGSASVASAPAFGL